MNKSPRLSPPKHEVLEGDRLRSLAESGEYHIKKTAVSPPNSGK